MAVTARRARRWRRFATYVNLAPFIFFALFPFYFMFVTSFKRNAELPRVRRVLGVLSYRELQRRRVLKPEPAPPSQRVSRTSSAA